MPSSPQKFGPSNPDGANCSLSASAFGDSGFVGASAALWVGPRSQLSAAVQRGERAFGLPSPTLGGKWAKESDEVKRGYFLIDIPPEKFNETVAYAARAGFGYIVLLDGWIATGAGGQSMYGHYNVSQGWKSWGGGRADAASGLAAAIKFANSQGVKVGLHTMSGNIAESDSYVTPTPDPRLATLPGSWSLASDLTANSTTIKLWRERVSCMVPFPARCFSGPCAPCPNGATTVRIGDELAVFTRLDPASASLTGVKRGAFGTTPQAYTAGTRVKVMARGSGPTFLAAGTLVDEIGANIARAVDRVGADTVYFDGLGQLLPVVSGGATERFDCSRLQLSFWRHAQRQVIAQSDTEGENQLESGHLWHLDSRSGQTDFAATDSKAFLDKIKTVDLHRAHRELFSPDLGWWGYLPWTQSYAATTPDEVAYMASRAAGWSGSPALETEFDKLGLSTSKTKTAWHALSGFAV